MFPGLYIMRFSTSLRLCISLSFSLLQAWDHGAVAIFHGVPDSKTAHIYQMNQATRSRNAPNCKPIPHRFRNKFGSFYKPPHKVEEMKRKMFNEVN